MCIRDSLINQASTAQNLEDKKTYYRQLQALLGHDLPYIPLWYEDHVFIAQKEIKGFKIAKDGNFDGLIHIHRGTNHNL